MRRWRARLGVDAVAAVLVAVVASASVLAVGWSAAGAVSGLAPVAADSALADAGSLQVSPAAVQVSQATTLTMSFAAPADPPSPYLTVRLAMPPGWTASAPLADPACQDVGCEVESATATQIVVVMRLYDTTAFALEVPVTVSGSAGPASFIATEQFRSSPGVTLQAMAPPVTVSCPPDQAGTMTVNPQSVSAASSTGLSFTYTAGSCALGTDGQVAVTVPTGWTAPEGTDSAAPGYVSWTGGQVSVAGPVITVPVGNLEPGTTTSFEYENVQAPGSPGPFTFAATEQSGPGGPAQDLASSPQVVVTPSQVTSTTPPPPPGGAGTMTVTPGRVTATHRTTLRFSYTAAPTGLSPSGEVSVVVPAGWTSPSLSPGQAGYVSASDGQLSVSGQRITLTGVTLGSGQHVSITYAAATAPGPAGLATFVTAEGPDGTAALAALRVSPAVTVAPVGGGPGGHGRMLDGLPILLVVAGLVLAAAVAGLLAFRPLAFRPLAFRPLAFRPLAFRPLAFRPSRRGGHPGPGGDVRAVPHAGPPVSVTVRDTGGRPALTVRIEPHAGVAVTTIEERQP